MKTRETKVTMPELGLIAGTRVALGVGLGMLLANSLSQDQRRAVGWTLLTVGALTTIPLAFEVLPRMGLSSTESLEAMGKWSAEKDHRRFQESAFAG